MGRVVLIAPYSSVSTVDNWDSGTMSSWCSFCTAVRCKTSLSIPTVPCSTREKEGEREREEGRREERREGGRRGKKE